MATQTIYACVTVEAATSAAFQTAMLAAIQGIQDINPGPSGTTTPANIISIKQGSMVNAASADVYWGTIYYSYYGTPA